MITSGSVENKLIVIFRNAIAMSASAGNHAGKLLNLDWSKVLEKCTPAVRKGITDLRARHEDLRRLILATQTAIPSLDMDKYRNRLAQSPEYAGLLDESERKLAEFKPSKIDVSEKLKALEAQREAKVIKGETRLPMGSCLDFR